MSARSKLLHLSKPVLGAFVFVLLSSAIFFILLFDKENFKKILTEV